MKNKRAFTLIEIMIALVILGLIGAISVVHIKKLIDDHRFEKQIANLFISLQEAQVLSVTYQTDIALDFFTENHTLYYRFTTFEPFSAQQFTNETIPLSYTANLKFKDSTSSKLHFDIYSEGRIEPRGILSFYQSENEDSKTLWIDLQYGHLIKYAYFKPRSSKMEVPSRPK